MIAENTERRQSAPNRGPARSLAETVQRIRLIRMAHSDDPLTAAIATAATLLLPRLDRLIGERSRAK
ncbi:MAG: hypothetical protein IH983_12045 [Planctomycetes bacterium]|nr:hypothetical protein [Planctomycetota bacterium]